MQYDESGESMRTKTFRSGIHPVPQRHHGKDYTAGLPVREMFAPRHVVLPMASFIGAPAVPVVKKGDPVTVGQLVAEASGYMSVPIYSSISGKVSAVEERPHSSGKTSLSIVIENDYQDTSLPEAAAYPPLEEMEPAAILAAVKKAGITGMGGATFPTHVKMSPPADCPIDCIILNGAECEPYLTSDHRLMLEEPEAVVGGLRALMKTLGAKDGIIGVEVNKKDAILALREVIRQEEGIRVQPLRVKYPQGGEKQLIYAVTRRVVPSGALPSTVGALVVNVATAASIHHVLTTGLPPGSRIVTVTGPGVKEPANLRVRFGTSFADCIEACGGLVGENLLLISGGPMMGIAQATPEVPVMQGTSGILVLPGKKEIVSAGSCLRCGRCVQGCPMGLLPTTIAFAVKRRDFDAARRLHVTDCMECGSCAYLCPGRVELLQYLRLGKAEVTKRIRAEQQKTKEKGAEK